MIDSIIFDADGTIWNSTYVVAKAWNKALEIEGYTQRVDALRLQGLFGLPIDDILKDIVPNLNDQERINHFSETCTRLEYEYLHKESGVVYEGFGEMLEIMSSRYPLFIVSNCQAGYINLLLDKTGFGPYIKDHLCLGDTGVGKAENIQTIVKLYNLKVPVYVGDTIMDEDACRKARVPFVHASYGFGIAKSPAYIIKAPMELTELFC